MLVLGKMLVLGQMLALRMMLAPRMMIIAGLAIGIAGCVVKANRIFILQRGEIEVG